ncbi:MAG: hypothetical protein ACHP93_00640, partial [Solirubrobacterales bacterium]
MPAHAIRHLRSRGQPLTLDSQLGAQPRDLRPWAAIGTLARAAVLDAAQLDLELLAVLAPGGRLALAEPVSPTVTGPPSMQIAPTGSGDRRASSSRREVTQSKLTPSPSSIAPSNASSRTARSALNTASGSRTRQLACATTTASPSSVYGTRSARRLGGMKHTSSPALHDAAEKDVPQDGLTRDVRTRN